MESFQSTQDAISTELVATTRTAGQIAAEDLGFLRASERKTARKLDKQNTRMLELAQRLLGKATEGTSLTTPDVKKPEQIDDNWRGIVDVLDNLLERADRCLDEYTGVIKQFNRDKEHATENAVDNSKKEHRAPRSHTLPKPQLLFKNVPKNDETTSFRPLLKEKPHALVPLEESIKPVVTESGLEEYDLPFYLFMSRYYPQYRMLVNNSLRYQHPYQKEIVESTYPAFVYSKTEPVPANDDPDGKTLTWVDTPEQVSSMLADLKQAKEIAIDLEHHDQHSYVGLVCLMQISTREKDWIVDTLKPWRQDLQVLNEVFADPSILKVFHGATMDMIWLQRDLGLYVVGLFDTYHATHALMYPRHGLAYLLKRFEDFDAQKQYQMADWRIRPLTKEMMHYARADTHYLLHVFDNLRNELIEQSTPDADGNLIDYVLEKSKGEALQRYERTFYDAERGTGPTGWLFQLIRTPALFSRQQFAVFKAVHQFRDKIARQVDESLSLVMRNDAIFALARLMPEEMPALVGAIQPISSFIQPKLSLLLGIIKKAKQEGVAGPEMEDFMNRADIVTFREKYDPWGARRAERQEKRRAEEEAARAAATPALAQIIQAERAKAGQKPDTAAQSAFWGVTVNVALHVNPSNVAPSTLRFVVPVPEPAIEGTVAIEASTQAQEPIEASTQAQEPIEASAPPKPTTEDAVFTIKELKQQEKKRKADEQLQERPQKQSMASREVSSQGDVVMISSSASESGSESEQDSESDDNGGEGQEDKAELDVDMATDDGGIAPISAPATAEVSSTSQNSKSRDTDAQESDVIQLDIANPDEKRKRKKQAQEEEKAKRKRKEEAKASRSELAQQMSDAEYERMAGLSKGERKREFDGHPELRETFEAKHNSLMKKKAKAKKDRKKARAGKAAKQEAEQQEARNAVPFDYANAPSVLNAPTQNGGGQPGKKGKNKVYDPYARALDTSKGAPKRRPMAQGKSKTFKS